MIGSEFYRGQGFGNQLWVYATIRAISTRKNFEYGFIAPDEFKGKAFLDLNLGKVISYPKSKLPNERIPKGFNFYQIETPEFLNGTDWDITPFDKEIYELADGTFIDGYFQSEKYLFGIENELKRELQVVTTRTEYCVIHFRAGDYVQIKDVFLPLDYYKNAMTHMQNLVPNVKFLVVTDGPKLAKELFPGIEVVSSGKVRVLLNRYYFQQSSNTIGQDFAKIQGAKYLILSNSSFSWWGAWTNLEVEHVIAPKYWARFNTSDGYWGLGDALTKGWLWLDRFGSLSTFSECEAELEAYRKLKC
jgi:hypothetical protein